MTTNYYWTKWNYKDTNPKIFQAASQPVFTCSKLTTETLEQSMKYVQS